MKHTVLLFIVLFLFLSSGCSENRAEDLFKTAEFEELQNNREHAEKIYREITEKYPKSDYAGKAKKRLSDLNR